MKKCNAWMKTTNTTGDTSLFPVQQGESFGDVNDYALIAPYGYHYNAPTDTLASVINATKRIAMATSGRNRIPVESGEVIFYHPETKTRVHLKNNGDLTIQDKIGTEINLSSGQIDITAPQINLNGNVNVAGDLNVEGDAALGGAGGAAIARVGDIVAQQMGNFVIITGSADHTAT